ncbi:MAG: hypothetical protein ACRD22_11680 [Terriglobia bacterium]
MASIKSRIKWRTALVAVKHVASDSHHIWAANLSSELDFWKQHLAKRLADPGQDCPGGFLFRLDPDAKLQPEIATFIHSADARILDVGAGPLTVLGKVWRGCRLDITAVDPLAVEYSALLEE